MLFQGHPEVVHQIFAGMIAANVVFVILGLIFARFFAQVINIDRKFLVTLIFITCMVGSYAINNVLYDLATCAIFGFLGYLMIRYDFPVAPMVLAQILGGMMESNYRRAVVMFQGDVSMFLTRPIALTILALAAFTRCGVRGSGPQEEAAQQPRWRSRAVNKPISRLGWPHAGRTNCPLTT
jgi:putative tricarboxylic transport membrane protein